MSKTRFIGIVIACSAAACARSNASSDDSPAPAAATRACTMPPPGTDILWQEVRASGFTFCVPATWRSQGSGSTPSLDPRTWRTGSGSITWGTGVPPSRRVTMTETVVVRAGDPLPEPTMKAETRTGTELIGGRSAEISETRLGDRYHTEARWHEPAVYLQGESRSVSTAQLLLTIHRTARFTPQESP